MANPALPLRNDIAGNPLNSTARAALTAQYDFINLNTKEFTTTGTASAFVLTTDPIVSSYVAGLRLRVKFHLAGTGSGLETINVNALGAKYLKQYDSAGSKSPARISQGLVSDVEYDGTDWVLLISIPGMIGEIKMWPTATPPNGYALCNGQLMSRTANAVLFSIIGTTYGLGDGSTTFGLPNFVDRMPMGAGSTYAANAQGGSKDAVVVAHGHNGTFSGTSSTGGAHTHTYKTYPYGMGLSPQPTGQQGNANTNGDWGFVQTGNPSGTVEGAHSHSVTVSGSIGNTGVAGTDMNLPPYLGIFFIIRV